MLPTTRIETVNPPETNIELRLAAFVAWGSPSSGSGNESVLADAAAREAVSHMHRRRTTLRQRILTERQGGCGSGLLESDEGLQWRMMNLVLLNLRR